MDQKEYNQFSEELLILAKLKSEQDDNLKNCLSRINRRRRIIITSVSSAAALLVTSLLVWNFQMNTNSQNNIVVDDTISKPTLIFHSGAKITLDTKESELSHFPTDTLTKKNAIALNRIIIPSCFTHKVILEDGTEVFLNANSELDYPTLFGNFTREVYLKGEGYFKVTKSDKQFIVHTSNADIKVFGTEFNINTSRNNGVETVLVSGSVSVSSDKFTNGDVMMRPNELFRFDGENSQITPILPDDYLGWMDGNFICNSLPLSYLLNDISMWYGVQFITDDATINNIVNVNISRDIAIDELLETIEEMSNVSFIKERRNEYRIK